MPKKTKLRLNDKKAHIILEKAVKRLRQLGYTKIDICDFLNIQRDLVVRGIRND